MSDSERSENSPENSAKSSTLFTTLPGQFPSHPFHGKMKTTEFLTASSGVVIIVEKLGKAFAPVISDMKGNIIKITEGYFKNTEENEFLEDLILHQKEKGERTVIDALQWLRRGLNFASRFFQKILDDAKENRNSQSLTPFLKYAYSESLERYHGWLGCQLFNILSRFTPTRSHFFFTLALDKYDKEADVLKDMHEFTDSMYCCVRRLEDFYAEHNLETHERV